MASRQCRSLRAFSQVNWHYSLALGFGTQSSTDSNNITYNSVSGHDSTLIGSYGNIAGNNSILIGSSGSIANDRVVGLVIILILKRQTKMTKRIIRQDPYSWVIMRAM